MIYEEYAHLLPTATQSLILESLYNNTLGDAYRVGGIDGDNLYPAYSNPWLMRAVITGWTGRQFNDSNMTAAGEAYASEFLDLFNLNNTLSEFNSPTYCGVSLFALTLWAKYLPTSSLMGAEAPRMIAQIWDSVGQLYNANLRNIAGPWDRTYGYDQNLYVGIMNAFLWSMVGAERAPAINTVSRGGRTPYWATNHADDFEIAPLLSVILPYHQTLVPDSAWENLLSFPGEHVYTTAAYSPPFDYKRRNVTTWVSENITVGAQSFDQTVVGGASVNPSAWTPAVAQWMRGDGSIGWFSLHGTESALDVNVTSGRLELSYPKGNESSIFTFAVAANPLGQKRDVLGWDDVYGVKVNVSAGSVETTPEISFCGLLGGACDVINNWEFWNFTYVMPAGSADVPRIVLDIAME